MFRLFFFLLLVLGLGFLFAWVADNPGTIFVSWDWLSVQLTGEAGNEIGIPLTLAIAVLVFLIASVMLATGFLRGIFGMPTILSKFFENRRRDRGYKALSKGLIAASSGDIDLARSASKESGKLLKDEPLVALLATQTSLLEGKRDEAKDNFKRMLDNEDTKLVALRGLFLEAERQNEPTAARHYAEEAAKMAPSLPWAGNAKLSYQAIDQDWDAAIVTLEANRAAGLIDKDKAKRQRAVLLTAKAIEQEPANPDTAKSLAKQAHKLAPELVPAATTFARVASRLGDIRGASKIIETAWRKEPHPELAQAYAVVRPGDSVQDRLKRARKLSSIRANHPESQLAVATAAIDAQEWDEARKVLGPILTSNPTERACLLMADIEEGQHGDQGRMRDWLSRAVRALRDPAWVAGNHISDDWLPVSPVTGEIDAFEWKVPVESLSEVKVPVITQEELAEQAKPLAPPPAPDPVIEVAETSVAQPSENDANLEKTEFEQLSSPSDEKPEPIADEPDPTPENTVADADEKLEDKTNSEDESEPSQNADDKRESAEIIDIATKQDPEPTEQEEEKEPSKAQATDDDEARQPDEPGKADNTVKFPLERRPDDPGVHPDKVKTEKKGFGLF